MPADIIMTLPKRRLANGTKRSIQANSICDEIMGNSNNMLFFITSNAFVSSYLLSNINLTAGNQR